MTPITPTPDFEPLWIPASPAPSVAGGCDFAVNPALGANEADIIWLPEARASAVILVASPTNRGELRFTPSHWPDLRKRLRTKDGEHLILGTGRNQHQLWLPDPPREGTPLAAAIPHDKMTPHRIEAAMNFWRFAGGRARPARPLRDSRLVNTLRALDGHLSGASYRVIAQCLFGSAWIDAEPWKSSSIRDVTIRLVRNGVALMRGGYRKFLSK
ncbi:DUF2285 domain-containing protein [Methylocystis parvus]|uniref:DUF2285 domain-containing protein n=1 Tax=Methylocystis parvus TaxID=134 RepID=UPI003B847323